jgi:serine/threonine-protein kinase
MGVVYRARDTTLNRDVAIKVLPDAFANDPERVARFMREALTLASLNHPNVAHVHGLEESGGVRALVMELVEGEDLSQRLTRGAVPIDEALPIAKQIAEAIEAAHEQGIIHRDLKPANIKVTPDGVVKVLDFGLAKLARPENAGAQADLTASPTITSPAMMTGVGVILGTAAYMAPEQARGREADKRSDIWAFGCVLYEMLTARRAFEGELISDVLASVLKTEPDWKVLPPETPAGLRGLLRRCLDKDPRRRLQAIGEARVQIEEWLSGPREEHAGAATASTTQRMSLRRVLSIAVASGTVLIAASALATIWLTRRAPPTPAPVRFTIVPPASHEFARIPTLRDLAVSPDGTRLAYISLNHLMVREMNGLDAAPLGDGTPLRGPFFSPDGRSIGFFTRNADGEIQRASIAGGSPMRVSGYAGVPRGGSWGPDNSIVFATTDPASGLLRVPSSAGEPTVLTTPDTAQGELDHLFPSVLPNGQAILFTIQRTGGSLQNADVGLLDLTTGRRKVLIRGSQAEYVKSGHLVYAVEGMLNAVRFDLARLEVVGEPVRVIDQMLIGQLLGVNFAVSQDGTLVYLPASAASQPELRSLVWVTRDGREEPLSAAGHRPFAMARLSPDGTPVALVVRDQSSDIRILDLPKASAQTAATDAYLAG